MRIVKNRKPPYDIIHLRKGCTLTEIQAKGFMSWDMLGIKPEFDK